MLMVGKKYKSATQQEPNRITKAGNIILFVLINKEISFNNKATLAPLLGLG